MGGRPEYQIVGRNLRNARKAHGLRQAEIAEKLNISENAYGEYERGIKLISTKRLIFLCFGFLQETLSTNRAASSPCLAAQADNSSMYTFTSKFVRQAIARGMKRS